MKLLTQAIIKQLPALRSTDGSGDRPIICKFFTPWTNWTWYVLEGEQQPDGDWHLYCFVEGHEKEFGLVSLNELAAIKGPFGLRIERDLRYTGMLSDVCDVFRSEEKSA
ncbi:DUF2958 domain-containing protein [Bowmanella sp. JS7-9]|uniref:DUF2958 domain-containing protein n=1 Tax=Pseudobowmanella zhangzhouensis TaxID=1537679 RepID=A0ABW1XQT8_9ALTE|nr:DUF2958 domain-containing protein [Bowmanella sp. JS7-9]